MEEGHTHTSLHKVFFSCPLFLFNLWADTQLLTMESFLFLSSFSFQHLGRHTPPYHGKFFLFLSSFSFQHLSWADTHFLTIESFLFLSISSSSFKHYSWAETHHITDLFPLSSLCQWMAKKTFPYPPFFQKFMTTSTEFATKFFRSEMTPLPPLF